MILIKSFFRKKSSKIYLLLFSIIILGLIVIYSLINYYDIAINNYLKSNLVITFASQNDYHNDLIVDKRIDNLKVGKIVKPDYSEKLLIKSTEKSPYIFDKETNKYILSAIYWDIFLIDEDMTVLYPAKDFGIDLNNDELILVFPKDELNSKQRKTAKSILKKKLTFIDDNHRIQFTIKEIKNMPIACIIVSDKMYEQINSELNYYSITLSDYKEASNIREEILGLDYDTNYNVVKKTREYSKSQEMMYVMDFLKKGYLIGIVLVLIILFVVSNNVLKDDKRNIYLERLVGFNKKDICINIIGEMLLLITFSTILATVLSIAVLSLINYFCHMSLVIFDFKGLTLIFAGIGIVSIIELITFSVRINKCLKRDYMKF